MKNRCENFMVNNDLRTTTQWVKEKVAIDDSASL
jgi:hypothetical protein